MIPTLFILASIATTIVVLWALDARDTEKRSRDLDRWYDENERRPL